jgi:hypothetical protein
LEEQAHPLASYPLETGLPGLGTLEAGLRWGKGEIGRLKSLEPEHHPSERRWRTGKNRGEMARVTRVVAGGWEGTKERRIPRNLDPERRGKLHQEE